MYTDIIQLYKGGEVMSYQGGEVMSYQARGGG